MRINTIRIDPLIERKLYEKHHVFAEEVELVLREGKPIFKRVGAEQLCAIGLYNRYITIFFTYSAKTKQATITTAYPSDRKQIQYYKRVRG